MIEQFSKWLELVPLLNHNNEGATYTFFDRVFSQFGILVEIFTNQLQKLVVGSKNYVKKH
jgi:hemoglobin-like flavoprotein